MPRDFSHLAAQSVQNYRDPKISEDVASARERDGQVATLKTGVATVTKEQKLMRDLGDIPGFFPTMNDLAERMCDEARVQFGTRVLEPSAGKGNIVRVCLARGAKVTAVELNYSLSVYLSGWKEIAQGQMDVYGQTDFLSLHSEDHEPYDAVVMNPPFEHLQDIRHVRHAYDFLKKGGVLVAITSNSWTFGQRKEAAEFREWLRYKPSSSEQLDYGTFLRSERPTGVGTQLLVIEKE